MKIAVAVCIGTSIKYQAVPSLATAQLSVDVWAVPIGKKRLTALTVFGVLVTLRNVTALAESIAHAPVKVQTRKTLGA
jgi:hypothetical protein